MIWQVPVRCGEIARLSPHLTPSDYGLRAIVFAAVTSHFLPVEGNLAVEIAAGVAAVWQPSVMLSLQPLWAVVFVMFGKSMVTVAQISFHPHHDRE